ncbi:DUF1905 domain-containing protein [Pseudarthrobacter sp. fls2-241-R2A-127]|uniref:DUF1905 domain-containing protein n=1 Tax=Pseudarthrobacter sp. fls2-241-R2A-127 TaxID=3040303 RepID=UPI0025553D8C|nr:DUF1905 domain-containing protein [Pseudarthrobacter sp. fls2-241-R2A-127]
MEDSSPSTTAVPPVPISILKSSNEGLTTRRWQAGRQRAQANGHAWQTSLFPDSRSASYLLPVKKAVREQARLSARDWVQVRLDVQRG